MVMMIVMGIAQGEYGVKRESQGEQAKERWATELGICHVQYSTVQYMHGYARFEHALLYEKGGKTKNGKTPNHAVSIYSMCVRAFDKKYP